MFGVKEREIRLDLFLIADPQTKSPRLVEPRADLFPQICGFFVRTVRLLRGCRRIRYEKHRRLSTGRALLLCPLTP